jgi:hypothetical protein
MKNGKLIPAALTFLIFVASAAAGVEVAGVKMAEKVTIEGRSLKMNGMGLRKGLVFKVYVAGLYLESPSRDAPTIISSDQIKSMRLHILRSLSGPEVADAISEGFWRNVKQPRNAFEERVGRLRAMIPDVREGDLIELTYVPGKGTVVAAGGRQKGVIEGKDFADVLFSVWLGENPVQSDLKKALLGPVTQ